MSDLALISSLPEVKTAVLCDLNGALLDSVREADPESVAAVMGYLTATLVQSGDELGLGALRRIALVGERRAWLVAVRGEAVLSAQVEPPSSIAAVEKVLDAARRG
jgi:predicted regulator of Ras-like GTPase activity (Roadblock/LC7/MglB family)